MSTLIPQYNLMKPMLPTLTINIPEGPWGYEIKYDGYRGILYWDQTDISLISRNGNNLNESFPEIIAYLKSIQDRLSLFLPLTLDGEVCILESNYRGNFELIQQRGRLKNLVKIKELSAKHPAQFLVFDMLRLTGENLQRLSFEFRKERLKHLFKEALLPLEVSYKGKDLLQYIPYQKNAEIIWQKAADSNAEGIIAKRYDSIWSPGQRTKDWLKIKNTKSASFVICAYDKENGYFQVAVIKDGVLVSVGLFSHGIGPAEREALIQIIKQNKIKEENQWIYIKPSICVELQFLEVYKDQLREPRFIQFRFDINWEDCTWEALLKNARIL
jgi:bifunctional non-homologous end joining protein LigD